MVAVEDQSSESENMHFIIRGAIATFECVRVDVIFLS
jgi:hypothetical protein